MSKINPDLSVNDKSIDQYDCKSENISVNFLKKHFFGVYRFASDAERSKFTPTSNLTKKKPKMKILQIFPTCNNLFIPTKKMRTDGYMTKFTNNDTITVFGQKF